MGKRVITKQENIMEDKPLLDSMGPKKSAGDAEGAMQKISKGIEDMIYGPAADQVSQTLKQDPSPKSAASILYKPARQALEQAEKAGLPVEGDFIFAVVTDGIDMLAEILALNGLKDFVHLYDLLSPMLFLSYLRLWKVLDFTS